MPVLSVSPLMEVSKFKYRIVTDTSRGLYKIFASFPAASNQGRLLFKGGLYKIFVSSASENIMFTAGCGCALVVLA